MHHSKKTKDNRATVSQIISFVFDKLEDIMELINVYMMKTL